MMITVMIPIKNKFTFRRVFLLVNVVIDRIGAQIRIDRIKRYQTISENTAI